MAVIASALRVCGVRQGDCMVGYLPHSSLALEAVLAIVKFSELRQIYQNLRVRPDLVVAGLPDLEKVVLFL